MKYVVTLDGETTTIELVERDGKTFVVTEGREVPAELARVRNGAWSLILGGRSLVVVAASSDGETSLTIGPETWRATVLDEREALAGDEAGARQARRGGGVQRAVMPGIVREVLVAAGGDVARGTPLLILEAMKMQNEVRADAPGRVAQVHVAAGTAVAKGDPLVTLA